MDLLPLQDIYGNLLASALWHLAVEVPLSHRPRRKTIIRSPSHLVGTDLLLRSALDETAQELAEATQSLDGAVRAGLWDLVAAPEMRQVVLDLFSARISPSRAHDRAPESVRELVLALWAERAGVPPSKLEGHVDTFLLRLFVACNRVLKAATAEGDLEALYTFQAGQSRLIDERLAGVERRLRAFQDPERDDRAIAAFASVYRQEVAQGHAMIDLPGARGERTQVPLRDLYVPMPLYPRAEASSSLTDSAIALSDAVASFSRLVVLGHPGGGKTTLTRYLCIDEALARDRIPLWIEVRQYARHKGDNVSLLQYLELHAESTLELRDVPHGAFEDFLLRGVGVLIFDGLDELLDVSLRVTIRDDIARLARQYPLAQVIVTSREVGYLEAPLDERMFTTVTLRDFRMGEVEQFVANWFAAAGEGTHAKRRRDAADFITQSAHASDLRRNPLMLTLLCALYRTDRYLPEQLPHLYEECARLMFERWDRRRGIDPRLPLEHHLRPTLQHLAHWIYGNEELEAGVTRSELVANTTSFLISEAFDDRYQARHAAEAFVDYCTGRGWVFTDVGTARGESSYQFTHRTFLEFFTAEYLTFVHESAGELGNSLSPRILRGEWDMVARMAFALKARETRGAAERLMASITGLVGSTEVGAGLAMAFGARLLRMVAPHSSAVRSFVSACVSYLARGKRVPSERDLGVTLDDFLGDCVLSGNEVRPTIADALIGDLVAVWKEGDLPTCRRASELCVRLKLNVESRKGREPRAAGDWLPRLDEGLERARDTLEELSLRSRDIAIDACSLGVVRPAAVLAAHGSGVFFRFRRLEFAPSARTTTLAEYVLSRVASAVTDADCQETASMLESISQQLLSTPAGWPQAAGRRPEIQRVQKTALGEPLVIGQLRPDAVFALVVLAMLTFRGLRRPDVPTKGLDALPLWSIIWALLRSSDDYAHAVDDLRQRGLSETQLEVIGRVARRSP
jgi:hypothetical protein